MPGNEIVVADTSPLLNLALIDRLELLRSQFSSISIPEAVRSELLAGENGIEEIRSILESEFVTIAQPQRDDLLRELRTELDHGEAAAIALAVERNANRALIDERDGRQVARRHNIPVTGVIGILLKGARQNELAIEPALDELRDVGFWISDDLYHRAIDAVTETDE
ncbi:DUF3368 domain-containing protein [Natronorubrum halophilum]|uniref:DUF3368 domain-containing protein n=1 Tax=Natronorubrum halophilum TaxID=1702106 RepID=UPI0010C21512|nr:DUF3368 domain-containing protein [Natronorubrum halophilum]